MRRVIPWQFLRFSAVGVVNTGISYAVFLLLLRLGHWHYVPANVVAYACGVVNSYLMNRRWTFDAPNAVAAGEFSRFVAVNLVTLAANTGVLSALVVWVGLRPEIAQAGALATSMAFNFVGNKIWTFRRPALAA